MQGFLAPVAASVSLFGIYLLLKYFPDLSLQTFIDGYFFLLGSFALTSGATCLLQVSPPHAPAYLARPDRTCMRGTRPRNRTQLHQCSLPRGFSLGGCCGAWPHALGCGARRLSARQWPLAALCTRASRHSCGPHQQPPGRLQCPGNSRGARASGWLRSCERFTRACAAAWQTINYMATAGGGHMRAAGAGDPGLREAEHRGRPPGLDVH